MRIICQSNKYKDYYDIGQGEGQDRSITYVRTPEVRPCSYNFGGLCRGPSRSPRINNYFYNQVTKGILISHRIIGFCGNIYYVAILSYTKYKGHETITEKAYCYRLDEIDDFVQTHSSQKEYASYMKTSKRGGWSASFRANMRAFLDKMGKDKNIYNSLFLEERSPTFVVKWDNKAGKAIVTFNVPLKEFEFYRVFPPYQAFQEVQMFMSNLAMPEKVIPKISDEDMIMCKSFDKYSFRKDKRT